VNDTSRVVDRVYRRLLLQRSGEDRLRMGCSMHATARALVVASVMSRRPEASAAVLRQAIFDRFYGADFDAETAKRIRLALAARGGPPPR
jgi:hypothetical protein